MAVKKKPKPAPKPASKAAVAVSNEVLAMLREALVGDGIPGVVWYATGGDLGKSGPFATPRKAAEVFTLRYTGRPPDDFCYWPEPGDLP